MLLGCQATEGKEQLEYLEGKWALSNSCGQNTITAVTNHIFNTATTIVAMTATHNYDNDDDDDDDDDGDNDDDDDNDSDNEKRN